MLMKVWWMKVLLMVYDDNVEDYGGLSGSLW
jgi:hypothetical protein